MSFRTLAQVLPAQAAPEFIASGFKKSASIAGGESEAQESASPSVGRAARWMPPVAGERGLLRTFIRSFIQGEYSWRDDRVKMRSGGNGLVPQPDQFVAIF